MFKKFNFSGGKHIKRSSDELQSPSSSFEDHVNKGANMASTPSPVQVVHRTSKTSLDVSNPPPWFTDIMIDFKKEIKENFELQLEELKSVKQVISQLSEKSDETEAKSRRLETGYNLLTLKVSVLERENTDLKSKVRDLEIKSRADSLIFEGLKESRAADTSDYDLVRATVSKCLGINPDSPTILGVLSCRRLGKSSGHAPRPLLVRLSPHSREQIWSKRSNFGKQKVCWVKEDLPDEVQREHRLLLPFLKAAKTLPDVYKRVTLFRNILYIDGNSYRYSTILNLPNDIMLKAASLSSKTNDQVAVHYTHANPLSNFHPSQFSINGVTYTCAEQGYQSLKAHMFQDPETSVQILKETDPLKMLHLSKAIRGFDQNKWDQDQNHEVVMYEVNKAKYQQNEKLLAYLLNTGGRQLGEASPSDLTWGTGASLQSPTSLQNDTWTGKNLMGKILMKIRDELRPEQTENNPA